jgi:uncharacterized protein (DUF2235 family)
MWALLRAGAALAVAVGLATWQLARLLVWLSRLPVRHFWTFSGSRYRLAWAAVLSLAALCALVLALPILLHALAPELLPGWARGWQGLVVAVVLAAVGFLGVPSALRDLLVSVTQRRILLGLLPAADAAEVPDPRGEERAGGRDIVILLDGTSNRADRRDEAGQPAVTNIVRLHRMLLCDEGQITWYRAGVGSDTSSSAGEAQRNQRILEVVGQDLGARLYAWWGTLVRAVESATGHGTEEAIAAAYAEIIRSWRPGDRIHILGFSRGAYAARCTAGVISRYGLLKPEYGRYAADVVTLYRSRPRQDETPRPLPPAMIWPRPEVRVRLLGLFDTVASLGAPLWGDWHRLWARWDSPKGLDTDPAPVCDLVCHAVSMDERRSQFLPTLLTMPDAKQGTCRTPWLEQVWFRGSHGDVGGGYAETGLSDIALGWMMERARAAGLRFRAEAAASLSPDPMALPHDELVRRRHWRLFGSWPRWHPVPGHEVPGCPGLLHASVLARAARVERHLGRPDLTVLGPPGSAPARIVVEAQHEWHRTGLALEGEGACYRVTWLGGEWRNATQEPCGPAGQAPGRWEMGRRIFGWRKRHPEAPWMALVITIAHPQRWPLRERGFWLLLRRLLLRDPQELRDQLAPIGMELRAPGDSAWLRSEAPAGLLHAFANDLWQTARNNAGGVVLEVARVREEEVPAEAPLWVLARGGPDADRREDWRWRRCERALPSRAHPAGG